MKSLTKLKLWMIAAFLGMSGVGYAQDSSTDVTVVDQEYRTVLDDAPLVSPRASGMAGAASGVADGVSALYYNPAGIGGMEYKDRKYPWVRQLHFPYAGASYNEEGQVFQQTFSSTGAADSSEIAEAVVDAFANQRIYSRFSMFPNITVGRIMLGVLVDQQIAAVPIGLETNLIETHYRQVQGPAMGFSITNSNRSLFLGMSLALLDRSDTKGEFLWSQINDPVTRQEVLDENTISYTGEQVNVGMMWRMSKTLYPSLSIVARNLGDTRYVPTDARNEDLVVEQNLVIGFSLTPYKTKKSTLVTTLQADDLQNADKNINKKYRFGTEYTYGIGGSNSGLGVRAGFNSAGFAAGFHVNVGLFGLEASTYGEDVGTNNRRVVDRRTEVVLKIDVAEYDD